MGLREDQAEAATSSSSSVHCVHCGVPVVRGHRCRATPSTSRLQGPPAGWREEVEAERSSARLDSDEEWEEELLPLGPIECPPPTHRPPP